MRLVVGRAPTTAIDCDVFLTAPAPAEDFQEYNRLLGGIIAAAAPSDLRYLISPTLTRVEAQTGFFDKLYKYFRLLEVLEKNEAGFIIENLDYVVFDALLKHARKHGLQCKYSLLSVLLEKLRRSRASVAAKICFFALCEVLFALLCKILIRRPVGSRENVIFSFFDHRSRGQGGGYRDPYFQPLIEHLRNRGERFLVVVHLMGVRNPGIVIRAFLDLRRMARTIDVVPAQRLLSCADILRAAFWSLGAEIRLSERILYKGCDIGPLLNVSLREDFSHRNNWFFAYKSRLLAEHILRDYSPKRIIYPYENHPWEKMMIVRRNQLRSGTKLVGFQHTSFSIKLLNHFPSEAERGLPIHPDRILTAGRILKEALSEHGCFPPGVVQEGCALRHGYLFEGRESHVSRGRTRKAAFAFSSDARTYPAIISNLLKIFTDPGVTLYLKAHPLLDEGKIFPEQMPAHFVRAAGISWEKLYDEIDLLLYHDNSLGIEAMRYRITSCHFGMAGESYDCDRLFRYDPEKKIVAHDVEEFRSFLSGYYSQGGVLASAEEGAYLAEYWKDYFTAITPERLDKFLV